MRIVGYRKESPLSFCASGRLLMKEARFNEEFQKLPMGKLTGVRKGVYHFKTHADMNRFDEDCWAARMVQVCTQHRENAKKGA